MEVIQIDKKSFDEMMDLVREVHHLLLDKKVLKDSIELLTVQELSIILGISESTIYRAIRRGKITKDSNGKLLPLDINEALLKKQIKCDPRFAEEFRRTYIYR